MNANVADAIQHQQVQSHACGPPERKSHIQHGQTSTRGSRIGKGPSTMISHPSNPKRLVSNNCAVSVKKAYQMAGHIYRTETPNIVETVVPLYKALVISHLEYCSLVWSPYIKKDILSIEKVQRMVTKIIPSVSALKL